jgi:hypothetical protein
MKNSRLVTCALAIMMAAALLNGCSNAGYQFAPAGTAQPNAAAPVTPSSHGGAVRPDDVDISLYANEPCQVGCTCTWLTDTIPWTLESGPNCGPGGGSVMGIAAPYGSAKIAYTGLANQTVAVTKLAKGQYVQVATLTGLTGVPVGISLDSKGNLWVTNSPSTTISEFYPGATMPSATYTDKNLTSLSYVAADKSGNVYVEGQGATGIAVDELPVKQTTFVPISKSYQLGVTAGGLGIQSNPDRTTNIWVNDQGSASAPATIAEWVFRKGTLKYVGAFQYSGVNGAIWVDPSGKDTAHVFAVNNVPSGSEFTTSGVEYDFPSGSIVSSSPTATSPSEAVGIAGSKRL